MTISKHKIQCFLKDVVKKTNPLDYKEFNGEKIIKRKLKEIENLIKMFDEIDLIEEEKQKSHQSFCNKA